MNNMSTIGVQKDKILKNQRFTNPIRHNITINSILTR